MKIVISTVGKFHIFALARQLQENGYLDSIYTGFPWFAVRNEGVARARVRTFPWVRSALMALRHLPFDVPFVLRESLHTVSSVTLDLYVRGRLKDADIFVGHDTAGLLTGIEGQTRGIPYVYDTGSSHIAWRHATLDAECNKFGFQRIPSPWTLHRELRGYELSDLIVVPSTFAKRTFVQQGVSTKKIVVVPYGVDLERFFPSAIPDDGVFTILFVGLFGVRKGGHYLLEALRRLRTRKARLILAGSISPTIRERYADQLCAEQVKVLGHVDHSELRVLMSKSHVLVLPSLDDGFGMVLAEAMACGCPIIASENTGAPDLMTSGNEGFLVPPQNSEAICNSLEYLLTNPHVRKEMGQNALKKARMLNGWEAYGREMINAYKTLLLGD